MAKVWPYKVTINIHKDRFRELLAWLRDQPLSDGSRLKLHDTVKFGPNYHTTGRDDLDQEVWFKDKDAAMLFKLAWGGK